MVDHKIQADPVQPYWCSMYEGDCLVNPFTYSQHGWSTTCEEFQPTTTKAMETSTSIPKSTTVTTSTTTTTTTTTTTATTITTSKSGICSVGGFENRIGWAFLVSIVFMLNGF